MNGQKLEKVGKFKYLGSTLSKEVVTVAQQRFAPELVKCQQQWSCLTGYGKVIKSASLPSIDCINHGWSLSSYMAVKCGPCWKSQRKGCNLSKTTNASENS